jgi:hypothetical protein
MNVKLAVRKLEDAEHRFLRDMGWRQVDPNDQESDWTPPEDATNVWDRDRAIQEARRRADAAQPAQVQDGIPAPEDRWDLSKWPFDPR